MAKLENLGPFLGSPLADIDPGVTTFGRVLSNAQADVAGLLELSTDDTQAAHINHSGNGRGARMGIPLVCQTLAAGLSLDAVPGGAKNGGLVGGDIFEFHWLVIVPDDATDLLVEARISGAFTDILTLNGGLSPRARLSAASDITTETTLDLIGELVDRNVIGRCRFVGVTAGLKLLTILLDADPLTSTGVDVSTQLADIIVRPARNGVPKVQTFLPAVSLADPIAPGASEALSHQVMDSAAFASANAISGWHTSRIDSNLKALEVYASGAPPPSGDYSDMPESALRNPTRDRYMAFTRKTFADEPIPVIPILSACLGGIKSGGGFLCDPAVADSYNTRTGYAPFATSSTGGELATLLAQIPDVPSSPSVLRWAVLFGQSNPIGFATVNGLVEIASNTPSAWTSPTVITGAPHLALLTGTAQAFVRDALPNDCRFRPWGRSTSGSFSSLDYCILAAAMWIEE